MQMRAIYLPSPHASSGSPSKRGKSSRKSGRAPEEAVAPRTAMATTRAVVRAPLGATLTADEQWLLGEVIASPRGCANDRAEGV